jgi:hypothetical protein
LSTRLSRLSRDDEGDEIGRHVKDPNCLAVEIAFRAVFKPAAPVYFSGIGHRYVGLSDRPDGVQWSGWHNHVDDVAELAVNLEGMKHDGWPVGRLVNRELHDPTLPAIALTVSLQEDLRIAWWRDAWATYKQPIAEDTILDIPAQSLTAVVWKRSLAEARACLAPNLKDRAMQWVTLPQKGKTELEVSPHFQVVTPLWQNMPNSHADRVARMDEARDRLQRFHDFASKRSAP